MQSCSPGFYRDGERCLGKSQLICCVYKSLLSTHSNLTEKTLCTRPHFCVCACVFFQAVMTTVYSVQVQEGAYSVSLRMSLYRVTVCMDVAETTS